MSYMPIVDPEIIRLIEQAVAAERERCAKSAYDLLSELGLLDLADEVANAIRRE